jgi:hypothetical protein
MDRHLFRQDIKKICLLIELQQSLSSSQKTADFRRYWQILIKKLLPLHRRQLKSLFFYFFALIFITLTQATIFVSASFLPKVSKVKERGWKLNFGLRKFLKLAGVSTTIASVAFATAFRVL